MNYETIIVDLERRQVVDLLTGLLGGGLLPRNGQKSDLTLGCSRGAWQFERVPQLVLAGDKTNQIE
jgi:hypothetical protein